MGVDLFIIYDNGSILYSINELEFLLTDEGINAEALSIPLAYGPANTPEKSWSSKHMWLQRASLLHIFTLIRLVDRSRAAKGDSRDKYIINADVDELLHFESEASARSILDYFLQIDAPSLHFARVPIFPSTEQRFSDGFSRYNFKDHCIFYKDLRVQSPKYIAKPACLHEDILVNQHFLKQKGGEFLISIEGDFGHYLGVNTEWKAESYGIKGK